MDGNLAEHKMGQLGDSCWWENPTKKTFFPAPNHPANLQCLQA